MYGSGMYKTKLCILFKMHGSCSRPNCTFAHGTAELRPSGESSFSGRRHNLDNDLRDRIGRKISTERRPSSDGSGRRGQRFNGHEKSRPFEMRRDKDYMENRRFDEQSDYAGGLKAGNRIEDRAEDGRNKFQGYDNALEEKLKDLELEVKKLTDDKLRLESTVERREDIHISRIQELETQLDIQNEKCRRITTSTKKFVKEYNHFLWTQDDLKRSQAHLQKLGNQLSMYLSGNDRDADIDAMSDEVNNGRNLRTVCDSQKELQNTFSVSRKRNYVDQYTSKEPVKEALIRRGEEGRVKRSSDWNMDHSKSYSEEEEESGMRNDEETINNSSSKDDSCKRRRLSSGGTSSSTNKAMSSRSMSVGAASEEAKGSAQKSLPPPQSFKESQFQRGEDEEVEEESH